MNSDYTALWGKCLDIIRDNVPEAAYKTWFMPITPLHFRDKVLTIQVPTHFFYEYLEEKYVNLLRQSLYRVFGEGTQLMYQVVVDNQTKSTVDIEGSTKSMVVENAQPNIKAQEQRQPRVIDPFKRPVYQELNSQLNPNYNFENYFSGQSNKLARTAGETIAANPGKTAFNPLFLYGESGVGKTHLAHAIGIRIKEQDPTKRVLYLTSHQFQVQYTDAVRSNTVNDFINFYQSIDVLLIDDIQEFAGKTQTQNTFFHIFNHLHQNSKQLVMTSDRPPVSLQGMVPRLLTRFKWGLTAELERPDYDLRRSILTNKIRHDGLSITKEVVDYIARNVTDNVRDLEGIIVSLMAHSTIFNREISIDLAERVLSTSVNIEKKQITIDVIQDAVCRYFNIDQKQIHSKSRKREIVHARQVSMYLSKKYTECSLSRIGEMIGKRDHATVLHACKNISGLIDIDKAFRANLSEIEELIRQ
ncbi:MAG: chromosomal replication initiator protein DnaA [Bacteroidales bacterium]|nr:chromosomal replication initiator protein DnaA [Bacteroidales bacterium]